MEPSSFKTYLLFFMKLGIGLVDRIQLSYLFLGSWTQGWNSQGCFGFGDSSSENWKFV
jgi:hypothetical protein